MSAGRRGFAQVAIRLGTNSYPEGPSMPLPLKTLRVFPNPWALIHHELGPQGACPTDNGGREDGPLRFVGAVREPFGVEKREGFKVNGLDASDPRGSRAFGRFRYPGLNADLTSGTPIEVPASSGYYKQRLQQGDLVPADERTAKFVGSKFADLKAAKAAGVAAFDADHGGGSWLELEKLLGDGTPVAQPPSEPEKKPSGGKA